ncbi:ferredoxin [Paracoccus marinaquae]|uniref:Ferredoxin n=1 Tax=Paracoccus marinaquae TaxID=2841926 RepID=A0ABS6APT2_9RHOB|nr:ferredoxin [Paracoccus marinaquae]MBU3031659.1 ferredoxin [Paracoccus marinaquae]
MGCDGAPGDELTPPRGLVVAGQCADGDDTVLLIAPDEPDFWRIFTAAPEFRDGQADPLDRWSKHLIRPWAAQIGGRAVFPSDGPPFAPFIGWALASGRCWSSPTGMLIHDRMGLFISFRGAVILPQQPAPTMPAAEPPCHDCPRPCLTACPVNAFTAEGYDTALCHGWLDRPEGRNCISEGCRVRRACPISKGCGRLREQSAWHMRQFHP